MRADPRTYWRLAQAGFRRQSAYLLATFAGLCANLTFGFIRSALLLAAVAASGGRMAGYDAGTMGAYVWLSQGLLGAVQLGTGSSEIGERVRNGDIAIDFLRPVDVQGAYLAGDLGRAAYSLIPRGLPSVLVGAATFGLVLPGSVLPYALGLLSVVLGVALSFLCFFITQILGFWVIETRGIRTFYMVVASFLGGLFVPIHLFPGWLAAIAHATPFPSILQAPVDVLSGRAVGTAALQVLAVQVLWSVAVAVLGRVVLGAGRRALEVQGG